MMGFGMGFGIIGLLLMVLFWGALILGGVWLVKTIFVSSQPNQPGNMPPKQASPREILDQRYARGEISREEYEQIKADLT
jgi:putative membrane protein